MVLNQRGYRYHGMLPNHAQNQTVKCSLDQRATLQTDIRKANYDTLTAYAERRAS